MNQLTEHQFAKLYNVGTGHQILFTLVWEDEDEDDCFKISAQSRMNGIMINVKFHYKSNEELMENFGNINQSFAERIFESLLGTANEFTNG